ncbi:MULTISPECIES: threonine ammonia-lyase IlvA [Bacillus]|jgi:threonine dehydratase|uniref:L-threonine dehydratase n=3 Tax=Bacillus amyloliquefaciens TaxID=1390 RepID=A0A9P1JHP9_BACAS|nr:threonine ammonia-lyase IlvA [Bacillus amyloliquefaciens]AIW33972.1 threonine dehydratase [Bacillus subtilis]AEB23597.1 threonine dehydratase [Bacillus amyloliquefaciens TA208]AEB63719.1 threonine dehydratase [Bacillus amyloliquefaciens LL3]AEK88584.1 threonine dehydratase [Bacillus amyloliquefaciens XH7]ARW39338.1 Threonine ammonia-lyase [Bacillus amyloliquefaciens]
MKPLLKEDSLIQVKDILKAHQNVKDVVIHTPLQRNDRLSERYDCNIYLKREDLQVVRSFKLRGAYNKMRQLSKEQTENGIVCASAGNHAQGVAFSCKHLGIHGKIFMPSTTPRQKVSQVELFGKEFVEIILTGDTFDDAYKSSAECCEKENRTFIHPFDDPDVMAGQGTAAIEILNDIDVEPHFLFASVGGGGLLSGLGTYMKNISPDTKIIAVEPEGAASYFESKKAGQVIELEKIDKFVDGAAVKKIGAETFQTLETVVDDVLLVPEGKVCSTILELYNQCAIVAEPAGALSVAALDLYKEEIKGKNVICLVSGGNNDIGRMQEMKERSMIYEGLQHYFIVNFPQRAGALREYLDEVLGPDDDITRFEYTKKNNKSSGPALVGIELKHREDYGALIARMNKKGFHYVEVNKDQDLFHLLI